MNKEIYEKLSAEFPEIAVERTKKEITRKGYDTTGYQYQFIVNRLNEVLGIENWTFNYTIVKEIEGHFKSGQSYYEITAEIEINIFYPDIAEITNIETKEIKKELITRSIKRVCAGGHISSSYSDALKGAITNAFKKTAALFGVGKKAYEGTIDEDYRPIPPQDSEHINPEPKTKQQVFRAVDNETGEVKTCPKCNAPMRMSKEGKAYCSALCWKK